MKPIISASGPKQTSRNVHFVSAFEGDSERRYYNRRYPLKSDVGDPTATPVLYDQVIEKIPALDTLINNAGIQRVQKFNRRLLKVSIVFR
jgi:NADP-dependent 3-hydroxy acid dehydrogenase YdfG